MANHPVCCIGPLGSASDGGRLHATGLRSYETGAPGADESSGYCEGWDNLNGDDLETLVGCSWTLGSTVDMTPSDI